MEATWHDRTTGTRQVEAHGSGDQVRRVGRVHPTRDAAQRAARAEHARAARQRLSLDLALALGRAELYPDQRITVAGFKAEIDATAWLISEVAHSIGDRGFVTALKLETIG